MSKGNDALMGALKEVMKIPREAAKLGAMAVGMAKKMKLEIKKLKKFDKKIKSTKKKDKKLKKKKKKKEKKKKKKDCKKFFFRELDDKSDIKPDKIWDDKL